MQEVWALRFFEPDQAKLTCQVLTIADWAKEYNELSTHPVPEIPPGLETPYCSSQQALQPPLEEAGVMDVWTWSQAMWTYLCSLLQFFEDKMAIREGKLFGGKTSGLVPCCFIS